MSASLFLHRWLTSERFRLLLPAAASAATAADLDSGATGATGARDLMRQSSLTFKITRLTRLRILSFGMIVTVKQTCGNALRF